MSSVPGGASVDMWVMTGVLVSAVMGIAWWTRRDQAKAARELDAQSHEGEPPADLGPEDHPGPANHGLTN